MKAALLIFSALFLTSCLDDLKIKNASLERALKERCENGVLPNKCVFDEKGDIITDLGAETLKDDESKIYDAQCVNFSDNAEHCGSCAFRCKDGAACRNGSCVKECGKNERLNEAGECHCPGFEGKVYNTNDHCGACGKRCGADAICSKSGDGFRCLCSENSANLETSVEHCGECGNNCNFSVNHVVDRICAAGRCDYSECEQGYIDLDQDRSNGCERELSELHIKYVTPEGVPVCADFYKDCNGESGDGCEMNLHSVNACGSCENNCATKVLNAEGIKCAGGQCDYTTCKANFGDCDGNRSNGCEINTAADAGHCSACGKGCASAVLNAEGIKCASGKCEYGTCKANFGDCDGNRSNGCEVGTASDVNHCSACGKSCASTVLNAEGIKCASGKCEYGTCKANFGDCDGNRSNGCEVGTASDVNHCSACGKGCASAVLNADGIKCASGKCEYGTCKANFGDCDGNRSNGCETKLVNNVAHCGACGNDCTKTVVNAEGIKCNGLSCDYESCKKCQKNFIFKICFYDRDGNRANGCETVTS